MLRLPHMWIIQYEHMVYIFNGCILAIPIHLLRAPQLILRSMYVPPHIERTKSIPHENHEILCKWPQEIKRSWIQDLFFLWKCPYQTQLPLGLVLGSYIIRDAYDSICVELLLPRLYEPFVDLIYCFVTERPLSHPDPDITTYNLSKYEGWDS